MYIFFYSLVFLFFSPSESKMPSMSSKMTKLSEKASKMTRGAYNNVRDGMSGASKISGSMRDGMSRMGRGAYNNVRDGMSGASKISGSMRDGMSRMGRGGYKMMPSMHTTRNNRPDSQSPLSNGELGMLAENKLDNEALGYTFKKRVNPYLEQGRKVILNLLRGGRASGNQDDIDD